MVDFARINQITAAIGHDFDPHTHEKKKSEAFAPMRWIGKMLAILELPVPARDEPATVAGEIDTNRKKETNMTYGNINDDVYSRLDNTKPVSQRDPFIPEGSHQFVVIALEPYQDQKHGSSVRATLEALSSDNPQVRPGSRYVKLWNLLKPSKFPSQANDGDRFADFVQKIKGAPAGHPIGQDCRALLRDRVNEQLTRGMVIAAYGRNASKDPTKPYVDVAWMTVAQDAAAIAAQRARLDANPATQVRPQMPAQPQYAQPPQQMQYGPPPGVPMQPQYGAPQVGGYAPAPAPAAPPTGGFLAQLPPQNPGTGGHGGNTGGHGGQGGQGGGGVGW